MERIIVSDDNAELFAVLTKAENDYLESIKKVKVLSHTEKLSVMTSDLVESFLRSSDYNEMGGRFCTQGVPESLRKTCWPEWAKRSFVTPHKFRDDRYKLFVFLFKNGMPVHKIKYWVLWHEKYAPWTSYDTAAHRQLTQLTKAAEDARGKQFWAIWRTPVYVMINQEVEPQSTDVYDGFDQFEYVEHYGTSGK